MHNSVSVLYCYYPVRFTQTFVMASETSSSASASIPDVTRQILESVKNSLAASSETIIQEATHRAVSTIQASVTNQLEDLKEKTIEQSMKKIKTETPKFSRKGNKDQFEFNVDVLNRLEKIEKLVEKERKAEALKTLEEGKKFIAKRQKLVQIADRESDGWNVVKEYISDDLASDSDDEKRINKARKKAAEKRKTTEKSKNDRKRIKQSDSRYGQKSESRYESHKSEQKSDFRKNKYDRECYICKRVGHLSYNCPER